MPNGATRQLAAYVATTPTDHFPDDVMDRAKYFVLDYLGVALRGSHTASSAAIQTFIDGFAPGNATIVALL